MWALSVNANFIRLFRSFADIGQKLYNWNGANAPREPKYFLISSDPLTESVWLRKSQAHASFMQKLEHLLLPSRPRRHPDDRW
jgi:hypothetical protein